MRKIEQQMIDAIKGKRTLCKDNTSVTYNYQTDSSAVYLHGNHIATVGVNYVEIFDGGYQSNTTKSRLNALLDEFSYGMRVFQKNYEWFVSYKNVKEDFVSGMELAID